FGSWRSLMRRGRILLLASVLGAAAIACSSSSSNSSGDDGGGTGDDSGLGGGSSSGGDAGGLGMMATFNCHSPADCTEGGAGQSCCFMMATYTASCQAGPCAEYTQCATNADCPGGGQCTQSPLSMVDHYCVGGGAEGGTHSEAGGDAEAGGSSEAAATETGAPDTGAADGAGD
ncbi:MAG: hypothetical protein ACRENE_11540, partial [Polyangiaceae bacterium]